MRILKKSRETRILGVDSHLVWSYKPRPLSIYWHEIWIYKKISPGAICKSWKHFGRDSRAAVRDNEPFFVIIKRSACWIS